MAGIELLRPNYRKLARRLAVERDEILEDCDSIKKAQRISRGEMGELAIGYMSALTPDFLGKALEVWPLTAPGIVVDCIEMDSVSQNRALLEDASPPVYLCRVIGRWWSC